MLFHNLINELVANEMLILIVLGSIMLFASFLITKQTITSKTIITVFFLGLACTLLSLIIGRGEYSGESYIEKYGWPSQYLFFTYSLDKSIKYGYSVGILYVIANLYYCFITFFAGVMAYISRQKIVKAVYICILLVILSLTVGFSIYNRIREERRRSIPITSIKIPSKDVILNGNLVPYKNNQYSFLLLYPTQFNISEFIPSVEDNKLSTVVTFTNPMEVDSPQLSVSIVKSNYSTLEWIKKNICIDTLPCESINADKLPDSYRVDSNKLAHYQSIDTVFKYKDILYLISLDSRKPNNYFSSEQINIYNKVVGTFEFTAN